MNQETDKSTYCAKLECDICTTTHLAADRFLMIEILYYSIDIIDIKYAWQYHA